MKCCTIKIALLRLRVTLYVRVWIEIGTPGHGNIFFCVTLYVRVWIEINVTPATEEMPNGHPLREGVD